MSQRADVPFAGTCRRGGAALSNRLKTLVLALFLAYWVTVVAVFVAARSTFDHAMTQFGLTLLRIVHGDRLVADTLALVMLTALFGLLSTGVIRNWRWTFWLILIAFTVNGFRVPFAVLQLLGIAPVQGPALITVLQLVVGLVQFLIAVWMLIDYRKAGLWGESTPG